MKLLTTISIILCISFVPVSGMEPVPLEVEKHGYVSKEERQRKHQRFHDAMEGVMQRSKEFDKELEDERARLDAMCNEMPPEERDRSILC